MMQRPWITSLAAHAAAAVLLAAGCAEEAPLSATGDRPIETSVVVLELAAELGDARRPAVEFDHGLHANRTRDEGCTACHAETADGALDTTFALLGGGARADADAWTTAHHAACDACHQRRADTDDTPSLSTCAACHADREPGRWAGAMPRMDRALHHRHVEAADDRCEDCHHVDDGRGGRVYREGEEAACRLCHDAAAGGDRPSTRSAAHASCVGCHLDGGADSGPTDCAGCHDAARWAAAERPDEVPRLMRGQPDTVWIDAGDGAAAVPFDHAGHERVTADCSSCHPRGFDERSPCCRDSAEQHACVACHDEQTADRGCAGCHTQMPAPPSDRRCALCHVGQPAPPLAATGDALADGGGDPARTPAAAPLPPAPTLAPLEPASDRFPETLDIAALGDLVGPVTFPHRRIVAHLDTGIRGSALATRFHGDTDTLCAGCHHHSPAGERPPSCASCHTERDAPGEDRPSLSHAYHRQCMDCHTAMAIDANGCTDCHERPGAEDPR